MSQESPTSFVYKIGDRELWQTSFVFFRKGRGFDLVSQPSVPGIAYEVLCFDRLCSTLGEGEFAIGPMVIDWICETVPPFCDFARKGHVSRPDGIVYYSNSRNLVLQRIIEMKKFNNPDSFKRAISYKLRKFAGFTQMLRGLNGHFRQALMQAFGDSFEIPELFVPHDRQITVEFMFPFPYAQMKTVKTDFQVAITHVPARIRSGGKSSRHRRIW